MDGPQYGRLTIMYVSPCMNGALCWCPDIYIVRASTSLERQRRSSISKRVEQLFEIPLLWWHYSFPWAAASYFNLKWSSWWVFKIGVLGSFNVSLMGPFITGDEVLGTAVGQDAASLPINSHPWTDPCGIHYSLTLFASGLGIKLDHLAGSERQTNKFPTIFKFKI